jgi:sulfite reductase (NADPH) flavoprotein alpha-component
VIMVGPGTGIAPFRAFLEERDAAGHTGRNWLFFGNQRRDADFLYREELEDLATRRVLTRMDLAFSRDQANKVYVQHRLLESAQELWRWLSNGAHLYVCGDAKRMAGDVDLALKQVAAREGGMDAAGAKRFFAEMAKAGRYQRDVY